MRIRRLGSNTVAAIALFAGVVSLLGVGTAYATTSNSSSYQMTEAQFGSGSTLESCSGQYCAQASIGDLGAGRSSSPVSTAAFGQVPEGDPLLEVIVDQGISDLGVLSSEKTSTKTMTVRIRNYLSDGYTLQIVGDAPKFKGHTLKTASTPVASQAGVEQFGINAVANTTPKVGLDPLQVPSDLFSFGVVNENYGAPNLFKYKSGDTVARSDSESGRTDYTISMIVNVSNSTPAGHYSGDFAAVVIPVF